MNVKRLETFIIITIIALIGVVYAFTKQPVQAPANDQAEQQAASDQTQNQQVPTQTVSYEGQDGRTALDLLKASHRVETEDFSFGEFVTSIDGVEPGSTHFWALYVNGAQSQVGASEYVTKNSDRIEWRLEQIE